MDRSRNLEVERRKLFKSIYLKHLLISLGAQLYLGAFWKLSGVKNYACNICYPTDAVLARRAQSEDWCTARMAGRLAFMPLHTHQHIVASGPAR